MKQFSPFLTMNYYKATSREQFIVHHTYLPHSTYSIFFASAAHLFLSSGHFPFHCNYYCIGMLFHLSYRQTQCTHHHLDHNSAICNKFHIVTNRSLSIRFLSPAIMSEFSSTILKRGESKW